jgi:hypothetical protein
MLDQADKNAITNAAEPSAAPIPITDEGLDRLFELTAPLEPGSRIALIEELAVRLRREPVLPASEAVTVKHIRALVMSGLYKLNSAMAVGSSAPRVSGSSRLCTQEVRYRGQRQAAKNKSEK